MSADVSSFIYFVMVVRDVFPDRVPTVFGFMYG